MEDKVLFRGKMNIFISVIQFIPVLFLVISISFCTLEFYDNSHALDWKYDHEHDEWCTQTFDDAFLFEEEDYLAVRDEYSSFHEFIEVQYANLPDKEYHDYYIDCDILRHGSADALIDYYFEADVLPDFISNCIVCVVISMGLGIFAIMLNRFKCKLSLTEKAIFVKKGFKKFDIPFENITELYKKDLCITIKTENENLKLPAFKKCDEIYNLIALHTPEAAITRPVTCNATNTVDGINLF